jgi:hypothetical protein
MLIDLINKISFKGAGKLAIMLLCFPAITFSQQKRPGSIEYLKSCNGLNGITLGADINLLPRDKLAYMDGDATLDADSCLKFEYRNYDLFKLGDGLKLDLIGLRTYKNKIVNIYLFFKRAEGYKALSVFLNDYGSFTGKPDDYADIYNWDTSLLNLSLKYELRVDLGVAVLTSKQLVNEIEMVKEKAKARMFLEQLAIQLPLSPTARLPGQTH